MLSPLPLESDSKPPGGGGRRTLLIVDDEEGPRQSLRVVFQDTYEVLLAESGAQALELAQRHPVDAAVLDIRMAGMSGTDLLSSLKAYDRSIEVLMLTAYETVETAKEALRRGACDYLTKPFELPVIRAAVRQAMERRAVSEALAASTRQVQEAMEELRHQQRTQAQLYASVIHDICAPLTSISFMIDLIKGELERTAGGVPTAMMERLAHANKQAARCIEISRRYLRLSRAQAGQAAAVQVNQVVRDVQDLVSISPQARGHTFEAIPLAEDVLVPIHGTDLIQMLLNLVNNAFQATKEPHRVVLEVGWLEGPLPAAVLEDGRGALWVNREHLANQPPLLSLTVQDNGPGIAPDILARVFETYFSTKSTEEGTGLGLSIVRRFVARLNGAIRVETEVGQGTTFTVYLPVIAQREGVGGGER